MLRAGRPPPYRSQSLDTGLDSGPTDAQREVVCREGERPKIKDNPITSTSHMDVFSSCENYLQQQQEQQKAHTTQPEPRPQRRKISSIPCESGGVITEENIPDENDEDAESYSLRRYGSDASNLSRKSSFMSKCVNKVRTLIKK